MTDYFSLKVTKQTKEEFDKQRKLPEGKISANEFLKHLLKKNRN